MKMLNIIGWTVVGTLCFVAPIIDSLLLYSISFVSLMIMLIISFSTTYDDIDKEIIEELKK